MVNNHICSNLFSRLIIAFFLVIYLSACTTGVISPTVATLTPLPAGQDENVIITFAAYEYLRGSYEPLMAEFHKQNPNITVQFVNIPEAQVGSENGNIMDQLAGLADTLVISGGELGRATVFRDLQPLMDSDSTFQPDDFWSVGVDACQDTEGEAMGLPLSLVMHGIYYDKTSFDAAKEPYPVPGWTWDNFRHAAAPLARQNGNEVRYGFSEQTVFLLSPVINAYLVENGGKLEPQVLAEQIQWYVDLALAKTIFPIHEGPSSQETNESQKAMFRGKNRPAMWTGFLGEPVLNVELSEDELSGLGFAPYPVSNGTSKTTPVEVQCGVVSSGSIHPQAAWAWLNFLSHQGVVSGNASVQKQSQIPARKSVADKSDFWQAFSNETVSSIRFGLEHAWTRDVYWSEKLIIMKAIRTAVAGKSDLITALTNSQIEMADLSQSTPIVDADNTPIVVATPQPTVNRSEDTVVLDFFANTWDDDEFSTIEALALEFHKKHPDIIVKISRDFIPTAPGATILTISEMASQFDCFSFYPPGSFTNTADQYTDTPDSVLNLDTFLDSEDASFKQDFYPYMMNLFEKNGKLYALPVTSRPEVMSYNIDLLAKRGLSPPSNDWTFDDFVKMAMTAGSTKQSDESYGYLYMEREGFFFDTRGVTGFDISVIPPKANFDSPEMVSILTYLEELNKTNGLLYESDESLMSGNISNIYKLWRGGKVAFWRSRAGTPYGGQYYTVDKENPIALNVGIVTLPADVNSDNLVQGLYISRNAKNPQACWEWIKFLSGQSVAFKGVPARKSVADSANWEASVGSENAAVYRLALTRTSKNEQSSDLSPYWYDVIGPFRDWREQAMTEIFKGADVRQALTAAQVKADQYMLCISLVDIEKIKRDELWNEINRCAKQADPGWGQETQQ